MKKIYFLLIASALLLMSFCSREDHRRTLVIGDSNGARPNNWVVQLQKLRPQDTFLNLSIPGNTIGFSNGGQDTLNTLKNIDSYLQRGEKNLGKIDRIILLIGTNDCKAVFDSLQEEVPTNLGKIFLAIEKHFNGHSPQVIFVTPAPVAEDSLLEAKYQGGKTRLKNLILPFKAEAEKYNFLFLNLHDSLEKDFGTLNMDGIHLNEQGYRKMAAMINDFIDENQRKKD